MLLQREVLEDPPNEVEPKPRPILKKEGTLTASPKEEDPILTQLQLLFRQI